MSLEFTPQQIVQYITEMQARLANDEKERAELRAVINSQKDDITRRDARIKQLESNVFFYKREIYVLENELDQYRGY